MGIQPKKNKFKPTTSEIELSDKLAYDIGVVSAALSRLHLGCQF